MEMIKLKNVSKKYGELTVYRNLNLEIEENKITAILGESGSGKTTLLNMLAGITDYQGEIENKPDKVSFVFQSSVLVPNLTVKENIKLVSPHLTDEEIEKGLQEVGMLEKENDYPKNLSGGMKKRVALLRAFLFDSKYLLLDEPFSGLDIALKYFFIDKIKLMQKEKGITVILVTHDIKEAVALADNIVVESKGEIVKEINKVNKKTEEELFNLLLELGKKNL